MARAQVPCPVDWHPDPIGNPGTSAVVRAMTVFDDGAGLALYVGGPFLSAGGLTVNSVAKWNGSSWSALGGGVTGPVAGLAAAVNGLGVHDDGHGPALYVMGNLVQAGGQPANRIAKWNGSSWSALGDGLNQAAQALATFNSAMYVGGSFTLASNVPGTSGIARWDGSQWSAVGGGVTGSCNTLLVYDDGTGLALYAGGTFTAAGGVPGTSCIARWNGSAWSELTGGMAGANLPRVNSLAAFDDGHGVALYAGGLFTTAGGRDAQNLARWSAGGWQPVGNGTSDNVIRLAVFDDGTGPGLYVGGAFVSVDNNAPVTVNQIARWDAQGWHAMHGGVSHPTVTTVSALQPFNDGAGPSLFVAGGFLTAGRLPTGNIVRWGCAPCYADCDRSGTLNVLDFVCFQSAFAAAAPYANCDGSTLPPVLNVNDFVCFQSRFAAGCP
jgi:hypothetical protein